MTNIDIPSEENDSHIQTQEPEFDIQPLIMYSRSLHDYTLSLWTEHRRQAEEKARAREKQVQGGAMGRLNPPAARTTLSSTSVASSDSGNASTAGSGDAVEKHERGGLAAADKAPPPSERSDSGSSTSTT